MQTFPLVGFRRFLFPTSHVPTANYKTQFLQMKGSFFGIFFSFLHIQCSFQNKDRDRLKPRAAELDSQWDLFLLIRRPCQEAHESLPKTLVVSIIWKPVSGGQRPRLIDCLLSIRHCTLHSTSHLKNTTKTWKSCHDYSCFMNEGIRSINTQRLAHSHLARSGI